MITIKKRLGSSYCRKTSTSIHSGNAVNQVAILGEEYVGMRPSMKVRERRCCEKRPSAFLKTRKTLEWFHSPCKCTITVINRGEKRVLQSVVIDVQDNDQVTFAKYNAGELNTLSSEQVKQNLVESGLWTAFRTRPFSKVPALDAEPSSLFVNAMDTNPLAANPEVVLKRALARFY